MKKWIALLLSLVMCLSLCACGGGNSNAPTESETERNEDTQSADDENYVKISTSSSTIPCGEYSFEIESITVTDEYYESSGMATLNAKIKNTSDEPIDYARICFNPLDSDYNTLGLSYYDNSFVVDHLKAGRTMTVNLSLSEVNPEDICYLEYTSCEIMEDVEDGSARTTIARQDLFDYDISVEFK